MVGARPLEMANCWTILPEEGLLTSSERRGIGFGSGGNSLRCRELRRLVTSSSSLGSQLKDGGSKLTSLMRFRNGSSQNFKESQTSFVKRLTKRPGERARSKMTG